VSTFSKAQASNGLPLKRAMKKFVYLLVITAFLAFPGLAQESSSIKKSALGQAEIDRIVKKFTENEGKFRSALSDYNFSRKAVVQIIGMGGQVTGEFRRDSEMIINPSGPRSEKIVFAPVATTPLGFITPEDLEDLGGVNPFALDPSAIANYNFTYLGKEHIDELDLYVFDVTPKIIPDPKKSRLRLFTGRIWVDVADLMIVKTKGKAVPETKENKFPIVETYRENIDGKYWFPTYVYADDELVFGDGNVVHIRMKVTYTNYKLGHTDVRIIAEEDVKDESNTKPTPTPTPKKPE
jgi:hypothetical protein